MKICAELKFNLLLGDQLGIETTQWLMGWPELTLLGFCLVSLHFLCSIISSNRLIFVHDPPALLPLHPVRLEHFLQVRRAPRRRMQSVGAMLRRRGRRFLLAGRRVLRGVLLPVAGN